MFEVGGGRLVPACIVQSCEHGVYGHSSEYELYAHSSEYELYAHNSEYEPYAHSSEPGILVKSI